MSYNKRYFNQEMIEQKAKESEFNEFDDWMYKPDACIFDSTDNSEQIWKAYMEAREEEQYRIYLNLKEK